MNIIELGFAVLTVAGGIEGGIKGHALCNGFGAVVGAAQGLGASFLIVFLFAALLKAVYGDPRLSPRKSEKGTTLAL